MFKKGGILLFWLLFIGLVKAQVVSGPMLGPVELRDARVWLEVSPAVKKVQLVCSKKGGGWSKTVAYNGQLGNEFNPIQFLIGGLEPATTYQYSFIIDGKPAGSKGEFTTKELWQWRKPAPDFSFLTGSCTYFNERVYDRPGTPYGGDSSIFQTMARENAAFMLWLGDNWYTREVDFTEWGLWYRAHRDRKSPVLQPLLKAMPQVATWDDHDFGPDNSGRNFVLKETSREVFRNYWCNPSYGEQGEGVYTVYNYGDVDLIMLDDRWWRSADKMKDSIDGKPNPEKVMLGARQMNWLKNALLYSQATFKIIVNGSQVLNPASRADKMRDFSLEYNELMDFLAEHRVNGVLFLTGDRHHSEIIRVERPGTYPLFDVTVSPLTSGTHSFSGPEKNNPWRVIGLDQKQNYGRLTVSGARGQRQLKVEFLGIKGEKLGEWSVAESTLRTPQQ